jgi:putative hydrolase of the HAD superfamily
VPDLGSKSGAFSSVTNGDGMIKNIIFDIGNVLMKYDPRGYIYGAFERNTADRIFDAMFHSGFWIELDRGIMSEEEILDGFIRHCPDLSGQIRRMYDEMGGFCSAYSGTRPWLLRLKEDYHLYYLSNYSLPMRRRTGEMLDSFLLLLEGGIFSYEVKKIKPDPAIYHMLLDRYSLLPEECVFIDDSADNVRAAASLGMKALQAKDASDTRIALDRLLENA